MTMWAVCGMGSRDLSIGILYVDVGLTIVSGIHPKATCNDG